jgi:hypothetical protein
MSRRDDEETQEGDEWKCPDHVFWPFTNEDAFGPENLRVEL